MYCSRPDLYMTDRLILQESHAINHVSMNIASCAAVHIYFHTDYFLKKLLISLFPVKEGHLRNYNTSRL